MPLLVLVDVYITVAVVNSATQSNSYTWVNTPLPGATQHSNQIQRASRRRVPTSSERATL